MPKGGSKLPLVNQTQTALHRAAIFTWFAVRTGLGTSKIVWANQITPRKALPSGSIQILNRGKKIGEDYLQEVLNGNIIERHYLGVREMIAQFEVYTVPATADTDLEALELLEQALAALNMRQVIDDFQTANIAALDYEILNVTDAQIEERWERRAAADVRFSYRTILFDDGTDSAPDDGTYIQTIDDITQVNGTATWNE